MTNPILRAANTGRTVGVMGDTYRFLATGAETGGRYALFHASVPPGGGPPPHVHAREVEWFYILEGEITFLVNGETHVATPGMFVHVPLGVPHNFGNRSTQTAHMLISVVPAGLDEMFLAVGQPLAPGEVAPPPEPAEIARLLQLAPQYGVKIFAPEENTR